MSIGAGTIEAVLNLNSKPFVDGLNNARSQLSTFTDSTANAGDRVTALGGLMSSTGATLTKSVTVPLLAIGAGAISVAASFEEGMSRVQALSGATGDELNALADKAKEAGSTTQYSASECASAFEYMALAGWDSTQMIDGLDGVLALAASSGLQLAEASDIVTDTLSMFNMEVSESNKLSDVFAYAQANSNTSVDQLSGALLNCGSNANAMGYDIEETSAMLMVMADQGLKFSSVTKKLVA